MGDPTGCQMTGAAACIPARVTASPPRSDGGGVLSGRSASCAVRRQGAHHKSGSVKRRMRTAGGSAALRARIQADSATGTSVKGFLGTGLFKIGPALLVDLFLIDFYGVIHNHYPDIGHFHVRCRGGAASGFCLPPCSGLARLCSLSSSSGAGSFSGCGSPRGGRPRGFGSRLGSGLWCSCSLCLFGSGGCRRFLCRCPGRIWAPSCRSGCPLLGLGRRPGIRWRDSRRGCRRFTACGGIFFGHESRKTGI